MILSDDVVQVFGLSSPNVSVVVNVVACDRCHVGASLVDGDLCWGAALASRLAQ
jgi:hypothetical protein